MLAQTVWLPEQVSTLAPEIDRLFYFVHWVSVIIFIGVVSTMVYFVFKYRRRSPEERPETVRESKWVEISWIVVPTLLVLIVFNWGFQSFLRIGTAPPDSYQINVIGKKWLWEFEYPNGARTVGELHVPANRPVRLQMSSEDVIHSFFIPAFRVKMDVLPNRYTSIWFEATATGDYQVFCTEYCGTQHSGMLAMVTVHTREDFQDWLESAGAADEDMPLPELGEMLYRQQGCASCHTTDGTTTVGPTFEGLFGSERQFQDGSSATADENYIRESIIEPGAHVVQGFQNVMPPYSSLSERQVNGLVEFIREQ